MIDLAVYAASGISAYVGHHVGDYWLQTDNQARCKGQEGRAGRAACLAHVGTYVTAQGLALLPLAGHISWIGALLALIVSGVTHYVADRRECGLMFKLAHKMGKSGFMTLGAPRGPRLIELWGPCPSCQGRETKEMCWDCRAGGLLPSTVVLDDNPTFTTGAWALDQSWHIFWGVFVFSLILSCF